MADQYDVVVIGGGPGGYVAAIRAAQLGLKAAVVEKEALGGVCLNIGCIPSKALLKNAELAHTLQHRGKEFGFSFENLALDYGVAFKRSRDVSGRLVKGVGFLMKKNGIDVYEGTGTITGTESVHVDLKDGEAADLATKHIIIATGAHPKQLPFARIDGDKIISYIEAILTDDPPKSLIIVGAGPIGVEFAYMWTNYGVDVTIVEMLPHLLPNEDPDVSEVLEKAYRRLGVKFHLGARMSEVTTTDDGVTVKLEGGEEISAEKLMLAIGFAANTKGIGLENVGVELNDMGDIAVDGHMRTNVPNIYAIGDVASPIKLAHIGSAMGLVAAETIAGHPTHPIENYLMMPRATYCVPQVASFGYTEEQAKEAGYEELNIGRFPFQPNGKALGLGEREGFVKIVADARYGEILGAHMIGPDVTELLPELTLAHVAELTAEEIARNVHAHPTLSEVLMEAAHGVEGQPIHI